MQPRMLKLAHTLRSLPDNRPALYLLLQALRCTGELHTVAVLMECWMSATQGVRPELALLKTYARDTIARSSDLTRTFWSALTHSGLVPELARRRRTAALASA